MKIHIKNIGMLDEAEFEVGDLTLICGENNTGKTYATYSLYGYLDYVNNDPEHILLNLIENITQKFLKDIVIEGEYVMRIFPHTMKNIVKELFEKLNIAYKNSLVEILAGKEDDFNNSYFDIDIAEKIISYIERIENVKIQETMFNFFSHSPYLELLEATKEYFLFDYKKSKNYFGEKIEEDIMARIQGWVLALFYYLVKSFHSYVFILSAERTGATMFQKELNVNKNEIVDQISKTNTKDIKEVVLDILLKKYSRYPKPVKDNIYFVRELDEVAKQTSFIKKGEKENALHKEIVELLYQVVGGKYIVSPEGIEFAPGAKQRITKGKFLVQRASSSVRSLLMLNYYVLHRAQVGDILMIDEPELNLHPKNQILVARLLVLLVNAGIKVFMTTHSDYIVRELSNCIMLKNLSNEQIKKLTKQGYSKEYGLESKKVKAYLAKNIKGKNTLRAVKITQEQGIFMETFDEPIDSQNENQGLIFEEAMRNKGDSDDK